MKLGLRLPQRLGVDLQHDVVEAARTAEAAGYASLWTYEQLLFAETPVEPYAPPNVPWPESGRQTADPLAVLTAAAVVTERVRLGTAVLIAALHTPVQLAKALATVDQISGGRVVAGMGAGWSTDGLQAAGATRADRGRFLDETLDVFEAVWGPDPVTFRSPRVVIDNALILPKPASKIPVMLWRRCQQPGPQRQPQSHAARRRTCRRLAAATHHTRAGRSRRPARQLGPHPANGF
jgi:probable F420-dependent oxidoreductase